LFIFCDIAPDFNRKKAYLELGLAMEMEWWVTQMLQIAEIYNILSKS